MAALRMRVLIVDDEPVARSVLREELDRESRQSRIDQVDSVKGGE